MSQVNTARKIAPDWSRDQVLEALYKAGWTLRQLALHHGVAVGTLANALYRPFPRGEQRIAEALTIAPQQIWPSRYDDAGQPKQRRTGRPANLPRVIPNIGPRKSQASGDGSTGAARGNVQRRKVA